MEDLGSNPYATVITCERELLPLVCIFQETATIHTGTVLHFHKHSFLPTQVQKKFIYNCFLKFHHCLMSLLSSGCQNTQLIQFLLSYLQLVKES